MVKETKTLIYMVTLPFGYTINKSNKNIQKFFTTIKKAHKFVINEIEEHKYKIKIDPKSKSLIWEYFINGIQVGNIVEKELE